MFVGLVSAGRTHGLVKRTRPVRLRPGGAHEIGQIVTIKNIDKREATLHALGKEIADAVAFSGERLSDVERRLGEERRSSEELATLLSASREALSREKQERSAEERRAEEERELRRNVEEALRAERAQVAALRRRFVRLLLFAATSVAIIATLLSR